MDAAINNELSALIAQHFAPVANAAEATMKLTTSDFFNIVERYAPGRFHVSDLQPVLSALEFNAVLIGEDLLWMARSL